MDPTSTSSPTAAGRALLGPRVSTSQITRPDAASMPRTLRSTDGTTSSPPSGVAAEATHSGWPDSMGR